MTADCTWARSVLRCEFVPKFLPQSQLIVVILQLGWLHETTDLGSAVQVRLLLGGIFRLLLDLIKLGVITGELLQCDEEVAQVESELVVLRVESEQSLNESSNLWSIYLLASTLSYGWWR